MTSFPVIVVIVIKSMFDVNFLRIDFVKRDAFGKCVGKNGEKKDEF